MVTVAEFTVPSEELPTGALFERLPGLTIELERIVPVDGSIVPYAWTHGVDVGSIERIVEAFPEESPHPDLRGIKLIDVVDGAVLLRLEWTSNVGGLLGAIAASDVVLVSGVGTSERWQVEIRGEDRAAVSAFQSTCIDNGVPAKLTSLHALAPLNRNTAQVLTDAQREALALALKRGYFRSPRETTLADMAEELGITGQSLGSRLRRGVGRLVANAVGETGEEDG